MEEYEKAPSVVVGDTVDAIEQVIGDRVFGKSDAACARRLERSSSTDGWGPPYMTIAD